MQDFRRQELTMLLNKFLQFNVDLDDALQFGQYPRILILEEKG